MKTDEPGFEASLAELRRTVESLESGELDLDAALARYAEGVRLAARCRSLLDGAEHQVALLTDVNADGEPSTSPFDSAASIERSSGSQAD